jgi:ABC-type glycerol-3-phosphate transport system substrate-binding protein
MIRILSLLMLASGLVVSGCGGGSPSSDAASADSTAADGQPVQVVNFRLVETENGQRQVMGTLKNTTSKAIGGAQIEVSLFDADNVRIETMSVTVRDIPASGEVPFKKPLTTEATVQGARVRSVLVM